MARISKNQLIKLQKKYRTDSAIADLYKISRQAVHQLRRKYGIGPVEGRNFDRNAEIIRLREKGMTMEALARKYKLSLSQVYRIVHNRVGASGKKPDSH
jgi:Mor family transcriptional regulator